MRYGELVLAEPLMLDDLVDDLLDRSRPTEDLQGLDRRTEQLIPLRDDDICIVHRVTVPNAAPASRLVSRISGRTRISGVESRETSAQIPGQGGPRRTWVDT